MSDNRHYGPAEDMSYEDIEALEKMNSNKKFEKAIDSRHYGPAEDMSYEDIEALEKMNSNKKFEKAIDNRHYGPAEDMSLENISTLENMIKYQKKKDLPIEKIVSNLIQIGLPSNEEELKEILSQTDYRLDLMKKLLEGYKERFLDISSKLKNNYSIEASQMINNQLYSYLALITTLKSEDYNFGSEVNSYENNRDFDPYKPELELMDIMQIMNQRRRNGANVTIPIPKQYDINNPQASFDSVSIINAVSNELLNSPWSRYEWEKMGFVDNGLSLRNEGQIGI